MKGRKVVWFTQASKMQTRRSQPTQQIFSILNNSLSLVCYHLFPTVFFLRA